MKKPRKASILLALLSAALLASAQSDSQREVSLEVTVENGVKNTIVLIRSTDGNTQQYTWKGDSVPLGIKADLDALNIDIDIIEEKGEKTVIEQRIVHEQPDAENKKEIQVIIRSKDGDKIREWNSEDELPAELQEKVVELQDLHEKNDANRIIIRSGDGEEEVFEWQGNEMPEEIKRQLEGENLDVLNISEPDRTRSNRAILGIAMAFTTERNSVDQVTAEPYIEIAEVIQGTGASEAGLLAGDRLITLNNIEISGPDQVKEILGELLPGDVVRVGILRSGKRSDLEVKLSEAQPSETSEKKTIVIHKNVKRDGLQINPVNNDLELREFSIHPNPVEDELNLVFQAESKPVTITVSDLSGKSVFKKEVSDFNGYYRDEIDLTNFPKGTLIIQVEQGGKKHTEKVIRN